MQFEIDERDEELIALGGVQGLILIRLRRLEAQGAQILMASMELKSALAKIDTATNNIAADITRLKDQIAVGMTPEQVAKVQAQADALVTRLEGIAASTPDTPEPPTP